MMNEQHIPQDELALHAMHALTSEESVIVNAHLRECAQCRAELAELNGDLALVAMSVEEHPVPLGARERFLHRIASESSTASVAKQPQQQQAPVHPIELRRKPQLSQWIPWALAAALAICAVGLQLEVRSLVHEVRAQASLLEAQNASNARAHAVMDLLSSPHAQHVMLTAAPHHDPEARAVYMSSKGALLLQASNLAPVPSGKMYELWVIPTQGAPIPAGLFKPDASGSASVVLPQIPKGVSAKAFGVTLETEQGSATPTAPILLSGAAPAAGE